MSYNALPTVLTENIFSYLRQERRQPPHVKLIKDMIDCIDKGVRYEARFGCEDIIIATYVWKNYINFEMARRQFDVDGYYLELPNEDYVFDNDETEIWRDWFCRMRGFPSKYCSYRYYLGNTLKLSGRLWLNMIEARTNQETLRLMEEAAEEMENEGDVLSPEQLLLMEMYLPTGVWYKN